MPESQEYIRGMRSACEKIEQAIAKGAWIMTAIQREKDNADQLAAENAARRTDRSKWPDGGGW